MAWIMSTLKVKPQPGWPTEYHVYIGQIKIAEVCFDRQAKRWKCYLRLMRNGFAYDVKEHYETMGDALRDLHRLLRASPPEGATWKDFKKKEGNDDDGA